MFKKILLFSILILLSSCSYPTLIHFTNLSGQDLLFFTDEKCKWLMKNDKEEKITIGSSQWLAVKNSSGLWYYKFQTGDHHFTDSNSKIYVTIEKSGKIFINLEDRVGIRKFSNAEQPKGFPLTPTKAPKEVLELKTKCH